MIWDPLDDLEELGSVDLEDQLEVALNLAFARQTHRRRRLMSTTDPLNAQTAAQPQGTATTATPAKSSPEGFKARVHALIAEIEASAPSRELALAKTKLEEALHWLESHHAKTTPAKPATTAITAAAAPT